MIGGGLNAIIRPWERLKPMPNSCLTMSNEVSLRSCHGFSEINATAELVLGALDRKSKPENAVMFSIAGIFSNARADSASRTSLVRASDAPGGMEMTANTVP